MLAIPLPPSLHHRFFHETSDGKIGKTWEVLGQSANYCWQIWADFGKIYPDLPTPKMPKNRIELRLVFQGDDNDPKVIVGKWLQNNKPFAIEALTMLAQVRELILLGHHSPKRIKLAILESTNYLQSRLQLIEQLGSLASESEAVTQSRPLSDLSRDLEIEL